MSGKNQDETGQIWNQWGQRLGLVELIEREGYCVINKLFDTAWLCQSGNQFLSLVHLVFPTAGFWNVPGKSSKVGGVGQACWLAEGGPSTSMVVWGMQREPGCETC